jgi:Sec-independent protein translocase protein TatA
LIINAFQFTDAHFSWCDSTDRRWSQKLPDLAKTLGKGLSEFKKATEGITDELKEALQEDKKQDDDGLKDSLLLKKNVEEETKPNSTNNEANK